MLWGVGLMLVGCSTNWCDRFNLDCSSIASSGEPMDNDGDLWTAGEDCDDNNPEVFPSAPELCDGLVNNCDPNAFPDEGLGPMAWIDTDNDGYGDPGGERRIICGRVYDLDYEQNDLDCDDSDFEVNPGVFDDCDGIDNDCDGTPDNEPSTHQTFFVDRDGDGFGVEGVQIDACFPPDGYGVGTADCDDTRVDVYPEADELCDNIDNDCDGEVPFEEFVDADGDGYVICAECDDERPDIFPGVQELCDGLDNNCDGQVDEEGYWYIDADNDDYGDVSDIGTIRSCSSSQPGRVKNNQDCDDTRSVINPGMPEVCSADRIDDDCDGFVDFYDSDAEGDCGMHGDLSTGDAGAVLQGLLSTDEFGYLRSRAGWAVSGAGDVNQDGHDDILVGDPKYHGDEYNEGAVYLVYGPVSTDQELSDADAQVLGGQEDHNLGLTLSEAGDVDGDGYDDVIIGSSGWEVREYSGKDGGTYTRVLDVGHVYLFYGPLSGDFLASDADAAIFKYRSDYGTPLFAGDLDGEDDDDIIVQFDGVMSLFFGPLSASQSISSRDMRLYTSDFYGVSAAAGAGDVDGDGYADLVVGHDGEWSDGYKGAAYLLYGPFSVGVSPGDDSVKLSGENENSYAGRAVSSAGDANGDGYDDILIGEPGFDSWDNAIGQAHICYGPLDDDMSLGDADATFSGEEDIDEHSGGMLSPAGDLNGDDHDDFLIVSTDEVHLFYGPASGALDLSDASARLVNGEGLFTGALGARSVAGSVTGVGDADGDGLDDILIGLSALGEAYLFFGEEN